MTEKEYAIAEQTRLQRLAQCHSRYAATVSDAAAMIRSEAIVDATAAKLEVLNAEVAPEIRVRGGG